MYVSEVGERKVQNIAAAMAFGRKISRNGKIRMNCSYKVELKTVVFYRLKRIGRNIRDFDGISGVMAYNRML